MAKRKAAKTATPAKRSVSAAPRQRVAYLGPEGTFTHSAVQARFGDTVDAVPLASIEDVFKAVRDRSVELGVVPVENSSEGAVNITLDRLMGVSPPIVGEVELRVHHCLMGAMRQLTQVRKVYAHPQALAQCRGWLDKNLPKATRVPVSSNAAGAKLAASEKGAAAIAGEVAASVYGIRVLAPNIEDHDHNTTRFLVLGRRRPRSSGADKTSIVASGSRTRPGSLSRLLEPLAKHRVNMTRIESRPSRRDKWEYVFFIDLEGHVDDMPVARALAALQKRSTLYRVLGSYPRAQS